MTFTSIFVAGLGSGAVVTTALFLHVIHRLLRTKGEKEKAWDDYNIKSMEELKRRNVNRARIKAQLQFEPRDIWIGLFWQTNHDMPLPYYTLHIYVCLVPLIPLHVTVLLRDASSVQEGNEVL